MPVVHPATYHQRSAPHKRRRWPVMLLILIVVLAIINYARPLPAPTASLHLPALPKTHEPSIDWPAASQAAFGAVGYGLLASHGNQTPIATASIAKVITALCVLQKEPLSAGQTGPTYAVSSQDVALYDNTVAQNGSAMVVEQGEKLTEYQALQALMLPSANNIADSLARWVFGSQSAYATYATDFLQQNGLTHTHIGVDASGFDASTTSTATDLTQLGLLALQQPVLMAIAGQKQAVLPVAGTVETYDTILGINGITGLKTGNNDGDTGAFLFTATRQLGSQSVKIAGAVMGAPDLATALHSATNLAASVEQGFMLTTVAKAGQTVGTMHTAWGTSAPIVASHSLQLIRWKSTPLRETHTLLAHTESGDVGSVKLTSGQAAAATSLQLQHALAGPSVWWRLTRH